METVIIPDSYETPELTKALSTIQYLSKAP